MEEHLTYVSGLPENRAVATCEKCGFLSDPMDPETRLALLDEIAALHWLDPDQPIERARAS